MTIERTTGEKEELEILILESSASGINGVGKITKGEHVQEKDTHTKG